MPPKVAERNGPASTSAFSAADAAAKVKIIADETAREARRIVETRGRGDAETRGLRIPGCNRTFILRVAVSPSPRVLASLRQGSTSSELNHYTEVEIYG